MLQGRGPVGHDLVRLTIRGQRGTEELSGRHDVTPSRHVHVDHLAVLVHCPVDVPPYTGDLSRRSRRLTNGPRPCAGTAGPVDAPRRAVLRWPTVCRLRGSERSIWAAVPQIEVIVRVRQIDG